MQGERQVNVYDFKVWGQGHDFGASFFPADADTSFSQKLMIEIELLKMKLSVFFISCIVETLRRSRDQINTKITTASLVTGNPLACSNCSYAVGVNLLELAAMKKL